ncbi:MAG: MFS transporter [Verrucomicrobiota bacterium]
MDHLQKSNVSASPFVFSKTWKIGTLVYTSAGLVSLCFWLLWGDFAWNMKERAVTPMAQLILKQLNASDLMVGLLVGSLPAAIGFFLGPVIGVMSDRHRGRWGRRIPFIFIPIPFITISMLGIAFAQVMAHFFHSHLGPFSPGESVLIFVTFGFFWTVFEVATVVANTVFGGLINDVVPSEVIGKFFGLFRAVSLIAGIIFNFWLMGKAEAYTTEIFVVIGIFCGAGMLLMCWKVKEGGYPSAHAVHHADGRNFFESSKSYIKECYSDSYYLWIFVAMALGNMAAAPVNSFCIFYAKSLGIEMDLYGKYIALTFVVSLFLSYFLGMLADRFHPLRVGMISIFFYMIMMLWGGVYALDKETFTIAFLAHGILSGTYFTCTASLAQRLFPKEKFGQLASAGGILGGLSYVVLPPLIGKLLDMTGHVYRYTFIFSGLISFLTLFSFLIVYRKFKKLGDFRHYSPPLE